MPPCGVECSPVWEARAWRTRASGQRVCSARSGMRYE
jgi:hypothetical protein